MIYDFFSLSLTFSTTQYLYTYSSLVQIKSHAQKVVKRQDAGEDIYQKLDDATPHYMETLVLQAAREREALRAAGVNVNTTKPSKTLLDAAKKTTKTTNTKKSSTIGTSSTTVFSSSKKGGSMAKNGTAAAAAASANNGNGGPESVIAAAALCQLSSVGAQQQWDQLDPLDVVAHV